MRIKGGHGDHVPQYTKLPLFWFITKMQVRCALQNKDTVNCASI